MLRTKVSRPLSSDGEIEIAVQLTIFREDRMIDARGIHEDDDLLLEQRSSNKLDGPAETFEPSQGSALKASHSRLDVHGDGVKTYAVFFFHDHTDFIRDERASRVSIGRSGNFL